MNNTQKKLFKLRPPRVRITYEVEVNSSYVERELPFIIGVISHLSGNKDSTKYAENNFINIDRDNFEDFLGSITPSLNLIVNNQINTKKDAKLNCNLLFKSLNDFSPDGIILQIPEVQTALKDRALLVDLVPKLINNQKLVTELSEMLKIGRIEPSRASMLTISTGFTQQGENDQQKNKKNDMIAAFARQVEGEGDLEFLINKAILRIDELLSNQINEILHNPDFQRLEARWRCLYDLIQKVETGPLLKIKLFNTNAQDLYNDLKMAPEFDQSHFFRIVYEEEYGTMGGIPFSCLLLDEYFDKTSEDVHFLTLLSKVASAAHAPMLVGTKPSMFDLNSFSDLHLPRELARIFQTSEAIEWNAFRDTEDARYINMFLPNILVRGPYSKTFGSKLFQFNEHVDPNNNLSFVWGNAAYAMTLKIAEAVSNYGWAAAIRGTEGGGLVQDLPTYTFRSKFADIGMTCPTQTQITDRREKELSDLGFIALCHKKMTNQAVFFSGQSVQNPKKYTELDSNTNSIISARMPYILNASRFIHYIKVIIRDKIGSFQTAQDIEYYVQDWIAKYVLLSDDADQATKARYPLREAQVLVADIPGKPGEYDITIRLRPHFQMEAANISVRFVGKSLNNS